MKKVLELKNITKIYRSYTSNTQRLKEIFFNKSYHKKHYALSDLSFELYEKETLGIIGVNGAGKSTALKIIAGVTAPTSGTIKKNGKVTALLELGTGFNNELTGYENIFLNATLIGLSEEKTKDLLEDIISFSELGEYIHEPLKTYSSGMRMRLAFSIAIHSEPQILIVDEALSVGDAHFSAKCTQALKKRKEQNMAIIYVSHDLSSLKLLCDRVLLLNKGTLVKQGDPEDVINTYNYLIAKLNDKENKIEKKDTSFGSYELEISNVTIKGKDSKTATITSGEETTISVEIKANIDADDITVGILIKDKFSQNIFGTNTYNHSQNQNFQKGKSYQIEFTMPLNIGTGKYFITAALHTQEVHTHNCSHWLDNAATFEVVGFRGKPFIGIARLTPTITSKQNS